MALKKQVKGGNSHQRAMERAAEHPVPEAPHPPIPPPPAKIDKPSNIGNHLTIGDTWTLLALLAGVLMLLITPTLFFKICTLVVLCAASFVFCRKCYWAAQWSNPRRNAVGVCSVIALLALVGPQLLDAWRSREPEKPAIHVVDFHPRYGCIEGRSGNRAWVDIDTENKSTEQAWQVLSISRTRLIPFPARDGARGAEASVFTELGKDQSLYAASNMNIQQGPPFQLHAVSENEIPEHGRDGQLGIDDLDSGRAAIFVGGIIRYKNKKGCVYHTYYCGFWRGAGRGLVWREMNLCPGGHNAEAIKSADECTP